MPTYQARSSITPVVEHGVTVINKDTATEVILTEAKIPIGAIVGGPYTIGETITETDSAVTGILWWLSPNLDEMGLIECSDEFVGGKTLTGFSSGATTTGGTAQNLLIKSADTPVFTPLLHNTSVTSTGVADPQTVKLDGETTWVLITNVLGGIVTVCNFSASYPIIPLSVGSTYALRTDFKVRQLYLQFSAAGTCSVYEYDGKRNPLTS